MKAIALVLCMLLATAAAVQFKSEADETQEAQLVDAEEVEDSDALADAVEVDVEADEEGEAEAEGESESESESEADADAQWWIFRKAAKKAKDCSECTKNGHLYVSHYPTGRFMCIDKTNQEMMQWVKTTVFPRTEKDSECDAKKKEAEDMKSKLDGVQVKTWLDKLEQNTKAAVVAAKGTPNSDKCPKDLWDLFVTQTTLERHLVSPTYAGAHQSALAGISADIPDYDVPVFKLLSAVLGKSGDIQDTSTLIAGGFPAADLAQMGAAGVVTVINAAVSFMAKKALEALLIDAQVRSLVFDPTVDIAECMLDDKIVKELAIMNWPMGDSAEVTIVCPVCDHISIPLKSLAKTHAKEHAAIVAAATQIKAIGAAVHKDSSKFTNSNPFGKSKAGTAVVTFLKAFAWMEGDKKEALDIGKLKADTDAGAGSVAFIAIRERIRKAARHTRTLQP